MRGPVNERGLPAAALDAVTLDANGTLVRLRDPVPPLRRMLAGHGVERSPEAVAAAFAAEAHHYADHCVRARDETSLAELRRGCLRVFLDSAGATLDPGVLAAEYDAAFVFDVLPGVPGILRRLRARGLSLAIVSNWDVSLHTSAEELGLSSLVDAVVASSDAGAGKPDPAIFAHALGLLGVEPGRALHVGDQTADAEGAAAARMRFAPAPLETAFA